MKTRCKKFFRARRIRKRLKMWHSLWKTFFPVLSWNVDGLFCEVDCRIFSGKLSRGKGMKRPSVTTKFYFILLYNFNATCFGLSTKRHHSATLQYQIKVTLLIKITLLFMSVLIIATLPSFCYVNFALITNLKFLSYALPLDLFNLYSTCICVLVQIYISCVKYFLAQEVQSTDFQLYCPCDPHSHKTTSPDYWQNK